MWTGGQRRLLSKNAAFGSWLEGLYALCPDGRFIICVREPLAALNSQISSIDSARALFGSAVNADAFQQLFVEQFADTLDYMTNTLARWPAERAAMVDMADLGAAPGEVITAALEQLEVPAKRGAGQASGCVAETPPSPTHPERRCTCVASLSA